MLKKILSLFSKKEIEEIAVKLGEIEGLAEKLYKEHVEDSLVPSFKQIKEDMKSQIDEIENKCKVLEEAKLKNEKIPLKEKQYMKGNRESYLKHVRILLDQTVVPDKHQEIEELCSHFNELIESFGKHTLRARQILGHFFEHETAAIHREVGKLNDQFEDMKKLLKEDKHNNHVKLKKNIENLNNSKKRKKSLADEIKDVKDTVISINKDIKKFSETLESKKGSDDFKRNSEINQKKKKITDELNKIKSEVKTSFSKLERAMKKYEHISLDNVDWVKKYITDPFNATVEDTEGIGSKILKDVKDKIEKGAIELKNNEKVISQIEEVIKSDLIKKASQNTRELREELEKIKEELEKINIIEEIEELKNKVETGHKRTKDHEIRLKDMKKELENISEDKYLEEIAEKLGKIMNKIVNIEK